MRHDLVMKHINSIQSFSLAEDVRKTQKLEKKLSSSFTGRSRRGFHNIDHVNQQIKK